MRNLIRKDCAKFGEASSIGNSRKFGCWYFSGAGIFHLSDSSTVAPPPGGDRCPPCGAGRDGGRLRAGNDSELLDFGTSSSLHQERTAKHGRAQRPIRGQTKNITQSLSPPINQFFPKGIAQCCRSYAFPQAALTFLP